MTMISGSRPCLRKSPFCSATHTAPWIALTELKPRRIFSCAGAATAASAVKMIAVRIVRFIAVVFANGLSVKILTPTAASFPPGLKPVVETLMLSLGGGTYGVIDQSGRTQG